MRWSLPLLALLSELAADETLTLDVELPAPVAPDGLAACSLDVQIRAGHTQTITLRKTSSFRAWRSLRRSGSRRVQLLWTAAMAGRVVLQKEFGYIIAWKRSARV